MRAHASILACLTAVLAAAVPGQLQVTLAGVPEDLCLPRPGGRTVVITATVTGGEAGDAWLGRRL